MRILIFRPGALGDLLVTLPLLQTLRSRDRHGTIHVIAHPHHRALLRFGLADADLSTDDPRLGRLYCNPHAFPDDAASFPLNGPYDAVLAVTRSPDDVVVRNLAAATGSPVFHRESLPEKVDRPMREHLAAAAGTLLSDPTVALQLHPRLTLHHTVPPRPKEHGRTAFADPPLGERNHWVFHAGAGSAQKQAPPDLFLAAMQTARKRNASMTLLEGPADGPASLALSEAATEAGFALERVPVHSALEAATILARCSFYVGNDSGISHLAAACGATGVALFGPTNSILWAPGGRIAALAGENGTFPEEQATETAILTAQPTLGMRWTSV